MRAKDGSAELLPPGGPSMRHPDRGTGAPLLADRGRPVPWLAEWGLAECPEGRPRQSVTRSMLRTRSHRPEGS